MSGKFWILLGLIGQSGFSARFVLQWIYSEYKRRSAVPLAFWYASIFGGILLLGYAIHRRDPVFITGQAGGLLVYVRNLQMRLRESREKAPASTDVG